jgi:hypothetical protein
LWVPPNFQSRSIYKRRDLPEDLTLHEIDLLELDYRSSFKNFLRLSKKDSEMSVKKVDPKVSKKHAVCRNTITVSESIKVTTVLAAEDCYKTLCTVFRISKQLICKIIPKFAEPLLRS